MRRIAVVVIMLVAVSGCSGGAAGEMDTCEPLDLVWFSDSTVRPRRAVWGTHRQELGVRGSGARPGLHAAWRPQR